MKETCTFSRASALAIALTAALLLLIGAHTAIASSSLHTGLVPDWSVATSSTTTWSSGWVAIPRGECRVYNHNLGGDPNRYAVELMFRDTDSVDSIGIHRRNYGGMEQGGSLHGAHWQELTANTIKVCRHRNDQRTGQIRIRVWVPPTTPDHDSGWRDIAQRETITIDHGVGITATDLAVGLWFSSTAHGIHHLGYGGLAVDPDPPTHTGMLLGAHWHNLTTDTVQVFRHPDDFLVEQVRVIVTHGGTPDYDSLVAFADWTDVAPDTPFTFEHNLNWSPDSLLVRAECYSPTVGIHQWLAGGSYKGWPPEMGLKGGNIQNLTSNTVEFLRWSNDDVCPQVHVRIWRQIRHVYLPVVIRDG